MKDDFKGISVSKIRKKVHDNAKKDDTFKEKPFIKDRNRINKKRKKSPEEYIHEKSLDLVNDELDIEKYISIILRFKYLIIFILMVSILTGFILQSRIVYKYKATTKILIKEQPLEITVVNNKPVIKENLDSKTWVNILQSPAVATIAANLLDNRIAGSQILSMIEIKTPPGNNSKENIITINSTSTDPKLAADVANAMYQALLTYDSIKRKKELGRALKFIKNELKAKQDSLTEVQKKINNIIFSGDSSFNLSKKDINSITIEQYNKFQEDLSLTKIQLIVIEAKIKELKKRLKEEDNNIISQMTYSEPLKIKLMNLQVDLARALTKYTEKHPKVIEIKKNIENLKKMINKNTEEKIEFKNLSVNPVHQNLINKIIENETEKISLEQKIHALNQILSVSNKKSFNRKLNQLDTKRQSLIALIADLQKRYNELTVSLSMDVNRFEQINEAQIPTKPMNQNKKKMTIIIIIVIGLAVSFFSAVLLDALDDRIFTIKEFTKKIHISIIGTIPKMKFSPLDVFMKEDEHKKVIMLLESIFKEIYVNFKYMIFDENQNLFAVTSSSKGEGKTVISLLLTQLLAREYSKVLVIDTDFFIPKLSKVFGLEEKKGLSELISNQITLAQAIHHIDEYNFDLITSGKKPPNIEKFFSSRNFITYMNKFKREYDFVILDTAPILLIPECNNIFDKVDGIILVAKILDTTYTQIKKSIKRLTLIKGEIMGIIINFSRGIIVDKEYENYSKYYYKKYYKNYKSYKHKEEKSKDRKLFSELFKRFKNIILMEDDDDEEDDDILLDDKKRWKNSQKHKK